MGSAHLKNFEATISPDPPVKGQPVTMTFKGAMDEDTDKGSVIVGANAGPIKLPQMKIPFEISPVIPHGGEVNLQVGPFDYPDISVPLLSSITSTLRCTTRQMKWSCVWTQLCPQHRRPNSCKHLCWRQRHQL